MFEIWKLKRERKKVHDSYEKQLQTLKKNKATREQIGEVEFMDWVDTNHLDQSIDRVVSQQLLDEARRLDVRVPGLREEGMWTVIDDSGAVWLSSEGRAHLRKSIDEEKGRRFDVKTRWVMKLIVPLLAALIGIIGALTGLVAVVQHRK